MYRFSYQAIKHHYEITKPIRGRSEDVRPAGERRKCWMQVVRRVEGDTELYGYKLYGRDLVMVAPDDTIGLSMGNWPTPSTAAFLTMYSPFQHFVFSKRIWARIDGKFYPLRGQDYLRVFTVKDESGTKFVPERDTVRVRAIDRKVAAPLRARLDKLIEFGTSMLKISDGWVSAATQVAMHTEWLEFYRAAGGMSNTMRTGENGVQWTLAACEQDKMLAAFHYTLSGMRSTASKSDPIESNPYGRAERYSVSGFKQAVYKLHDAGEPRVYRIDTIPVSDKMPRNIVD